jgi:hypothetical protein
MLIRLALMTAVLVAAPAVAQTPASPSQASGEDVRSATRAMGRACAAEIQSHCAGTGGQKRRECLRKNSDKLSEACRTALSDLSRARQARQAGDNRQDED